MSNSMWDTMVSWQNLGHIFTILFKLDLYKKYLLKRWLTDIILLGKNVPWISQQNHSHFLRAWHCSILKEIKDFFDSFLGKTLVNYVSPKTKLYNQNAIKIRMISFRNDYTPLQLYGFQQRWRAIDTLTDRRPIKWMFHLPRRKQGHKCPGRWQKRQNWEACFRSCSSFLCL